MGQGQGIGREQRGMLDLIEALGASLDLYQVLHSAYGLLLPLVGADYGALAVTQGARPDDYEWIDQNLPPSFLGAYAEMAPYDFVRAAVIARPNLVLCDADMVDRRSLERNMMYERARQLGSPIEQVMAVMLHVDGTWQSGLSLYRDRRRPFSGRDRLRLQRLTPHFANAVRNCRTHAALAHRRDVVEALLGAQDGAVALVQPPAKEIERTARTDALLDAWFMPGERRGRALPSVLLDELRAAMHAHATGNVAPRTWRRDRKDEYLEVTVSPVPGRQDGRLWVLAFKEVSHDPALPPPRSPLTRRETQVASLLMRGLDDKEIAQRLECATNTVKKHVQQLFSKYDLPVGGRGRRVLMNLRRHPH